jgi:hypothetical protein
MVCKYCKDDNKIIRTVAWAIYLAPLAYSAYMVLKGTGVLTKTKKTIEPYIESAKSKVNEATTLTQDFVVDKIEHIADYAKEVVAAPDKSTK